jgi:hypothetical protein
MFAPDPKLAACLEVLYRAAIDARSIGYAGEHRALTSADARKLADLMDAIHNIPKLAADWERCDEQLLRGMLADYDRSHDGHLLWTYDRAAARASAGG